MKYSIIIATYNRLDELKELFVTINSVEFDPAQFQIVIVDDGSTDGTRSFIKSLVTPYNIDYISQENQGPGAARNLGMQNAKGEYFIFIDSDVLLPKNYLRAIDNRLSIKALDAFGGPDDSHPSFGRFLKAVNYSMTSFIGTGGTRGSKKSVTKFYPRSFNMGIHRRVFEKIGGMGGLRHGQDMDYSARIYDAGFEVGFIPEAIVFHKRRTSLWRFYKQIFNWGVARINLGKKYPDMLKIIHLLPALIILGLICLLLLSPFFTWAKVLASLAGLMALCVAGFAFIQSFIRYQDIQVSFLSVVTLFTQVFAYGLGLISASLQILSGKKEARGITKNYYK